MADTQEQETELHHWEMGDIITTKKLNAIVNRIIENTTTIKQHNVTLTEYDQRLDTLESNTTGISYNNDSNSDLTTIDNNVIVNGNLNLVSTTNNNLITITQQANNSQTNLLQIAPSAMTLSVPATITGKVTINNPAVQIDGQDLVTKNAAQTLINDSIGELNVNSISCTGLETLGTISEASGKISVTKRTILYADASNDGYMSHDHVAALNASAQKVLYKPVTMNASGNIDIAASTTISANQHEINLGNVVTSLANVASQTEVSALSKEIYGDYTDANSANHFIGLKDIIWGREATGDTPAIAGIVEDINKLSPLENLPTTVGRYVIEITMDNDNNPVISWVPLENNGGEST